MAGSDVEDESLPVLNWEFFVGEAVVCFEKHKTRGERRAFVAIDESVIAAEVASV